MDKYVSFRNIPHKWGLNEGDVVFISSDVTDLFATCLKNGEKFDFNVFIDEILKVVGETGTVIFPTYNWDFCHNVAFNYKKTRSKTGCLGDIALKRDDFKRTRHPIYSFAVAGKDQDLLCNMNNKTSFGADSPFAYFEKVRAKNVIIDVPYNSCYTFIHYVEQKVGTAYRYEKTFTSEYIDEDGNSTIKSYSMYVRDLDMKVVNDMTEMGVIFEENGISKKLVINGIDFWVVDMASTVPLIENDIRNNRSRKLCKYIGQ